MDSKGLMRILVPTAGCSVFRMCGQWHVTGLLQQDNKKTEGRVLSGGFDAEEDAWDDAVRIAGLRTLGLDPEVPCKEFPEDHSA